MAANGPYCRGWELSVGVRRFFGLSVESVTVGGGLVAGSASGAGRSRRAVVLSSDFGLSNPPLWRTCPEPKWFMPGWERDVCGTGGDNHPYTRSLIEQNIERGLAWQFS